MSIVRERKIRGIRIPANSMSLTIDGEISYDGTSLLVHAQGGVRTVATLDQTQTISNKTLDLTNTVAYDDTLQPVITLGSSNVQGAIDAIKVALDAQNEASEISFTPVAPIIATNVQAAIEEVQTNLTNHITQAVDAHDATAISYDNTTSGLTATQVQAAIDEVEVRLETAETASTALTTRVDNLTTLSGVAANEPDLGVFTGVTIPNDQTIKQALQALETAHEALGTDFSSHELASTDVHGVGVGNSVVGTGTTQTLTNKTVETGLFDGTSRFSTITDSAATGSNATVVSSQHIVRVTNGSLVSISDIIESESTTFGGKIILINSTGNPITVVNDSGVVPARGIITGTGGDLKLAVDASIWLVYDVTSDRWRVAGGSGGGGASLSFEKSAAVGITALQPVFVNTSGGVALAVNSSRNFSGFATNTALAAAPVVVQIAGVLGGFAGLVTGSEYYLDITAGNITATKPTQGWQLIVGVAVSSTEMLINPDLGSSAKFVEQETYSILNNQTTPVAVTGLSFNPANERSVKVEYVITRSTSLTELTEAGSFRVVYNAFTSSWTLGSQEFCGENSGVVLTIGTGGDIGYTSTNLTGTGYAGFLSLVKVTRILI